MVLTVKKNIWMSLNLPKKRRREILRCIRKMTNVRSSLLKTLTIVMWSFFNELSGGKSGIISNAVPHGVQENATFIVNIDGLKHRKDENSDVNAAWVLTGCKRKFYTVVKDDDGKIVELEKVNNEERSAVAVKRRTYKCSSYAVYHQTVVSIEFVQEILKNVVPCCASSLSF